MYTMRPAEFEYHRPTSLDEAISLLGEVEGSRPIAGGHSLLPMMKLRLAAPTALVDLGGIPGLDGIEANGGLTIGALATHASVLASEVAIGIAPVIPETAAMIGDRQVRNRGTMGGSVAHADPGADYPTVLKALGATITATGSGGEREISADDFFRGIFDTALEPGELVDLGEGAGDGGRDWCGVLEARPSCLALRGRRRCRRGVGRERELHERACDGRRPDRASGSRGGRVARRQPGLRRGDRGSGREGAGLASGSRW